MMPLTPIAAVVFALQTAASPPSPTAANATSAVSRRGFVSQLGDVVGLNGLAAPRRLEVAPYAVAKNLPAAGFERDQKFDGGADIKYGITSNITVDATVNPDFGQVEADPSVVNLTSFETFYQERRPFF